ncbi:MAG TPA: DUF4261 domain-containing protein [Polyangia bacterium]|nr:DUF4261 domain-containing protein [Polyangia bacterium]
MRSRFGWLAALLTLAAVFAIGAAPDARAEAGKPLNLAFVLLSEPALPSGEAIARAYARFAPKTEHLRVKGTTSKGKMSVLELDLSPHGTAFVALMPVPVPQGEADEAARYSLSAIGTGWKLGPHKAHLMVTFHGAGGDGALAALNRFTSLVAAVTQSAPAVGVYWGEAGATHDPKYVVATAAEPGIVPRITLWTGVSMARDGASRLSLLSLGMKQLGLPELLLTAPKGDAGRAFETFFDLLAYVAERGKALPDGDTVGRSESERLPVHYVASPIKPGERVWRVDLE